MITAEVKCKRLTDKSMGSCLNPSDYKLQISGLSVGPFSGYPLLQVNHRVTKGV